MEYADVYDLAKECMCLSDAITTIGFRLRDEEDITEIAYNHAASAMEEWESITFQSPQAREMLIQVLKDELNYKEQQLKQAASR